MKVLQEPDRLIEDTALADVMQSADDDSDAAAIVTLERSLLAAGMLSVAAVGVAATATAAPAALAPAAAGPSALSVAATTFTWKVALAAVAITVGSTAAAVTLLDRPEDAAPTTVIAWPPAEASSSEPVPPVERPEAMSSAEALPSVEGPTPVGTPETVPTVPAHAAAPSSTGRAVVASAPVLEPQQPTPTEPAPRALLSGEIALIRGMRAALATDPTRVVQLAAEHRATFGEGRLGAERDRLEERARTALGEPPVTTMVTP